jgi:hypothetical protein
MAATPKLKLLLFSVFAFCTDILFAQLHSSAPTSSMVLASVNDLSRPGMQFGFDSNMANITGYLDTLNGKAAIPISNQPFSAADSVMQQLIGTHEIKETTKSYSKTYHVQNSDLLTIENSFGNVTVNTWNKNEVRVDAIIKVYATNASDAKNFLSVINITDSRLTSSIAFKTVIGDAGNTDQQLWKSDYKSHVKKIEVSYVVNMPAKNALNINNRFGDINLPALDGKLVIHNFYGSLNAKSLSNPQNDIVVISGNATIEKLMGGNLYIAYGKLDLTESDKLNANISYSHAAIGTIHTSGNIKVKYSDVLQIGALDKGLKTLNITSSYSSLKMNMTGNENADFDLNMLYSIFNHGKNVNIYDKKDSVIETAQDLRKNYSGHLGKGNAEKTINIKSDYGQILFD